MKNLTEKLIVLGLYGAGVVTGLLFSRAQYYQGRIDSNEEFRELLKKAKEEVINRRK